MKGSLLLIGLVAGAVIASKLLFDDVLGIFSADIVRSWVDDAGTAGALAIVALLAVDILLPVPSSLVMILSGALFGVFWGSLFSFIGSIGGEWLGFELVRRYGKRASSRLAGEAEIARLERLFAQHGAAVVAMTRALPVVMETTSVVAGLSAMRRSTFLIASAIGTAPIVVVYAYAGMMSRQAGSMVPAVIILIAVAGCGWIWYRVNYPKPLSSAASRDSRPAAPTPSADSHS